MHEQVDFKRRRRKSSQRQTQPPDQRLPVGGLRWFQAGLAQCREDEAVDWMAYALLGLRVAQWLKCPMLFFDSFIEARSARRCGRGSVISRPGRSQVDPFLDGGDFLCSQLSTDRHLQALVPDSFCEEAQTGVAWQNGGAAAGAFEKALAGIDTQ